MLSMTPLNCRKVLNSPPNFQTWRPFAHVNASSYEKSRSSLRITPAVVDRLLTPLMVMVGNPWAYVARLGNSLSFSSCQGKGKNHWE